MSVPYYGDFAEDDTVNIPFNTFDSNDPSGSVTATDLIAGDISVHKDGSATEIGDDDGASIDIDAPGVGAHMITIDTSADVDYAPGSEYAVRIDGVTVDGGTVNAWVGAFSIERAGGVLALLKGTNSLANIEDKIDIIDTNVDQIETAVITNATGTDIAADIIAMKAETAFIVADTDVIDDGTSGLVKIASDVATILVDTDVIDDGTSGLVKIASDVAAVLVDTGTTLQDELDGIQAATEDLQTQVGTAGAGLTAVPWNAAWDAEVESEVNDALDTAISELGVAAPTATPTIRTALMLLYMALRNKTVVQTSGTDALEIYNNAGTKIAAKLLTDDGSDYTEAEMA